MKRKLVIAAGGTGGHIFPALAVANRLQQDGVEIHWLGSVVGMEKELVSPHYPIQYLKIRGVRGNGVLRKLLAPFQIVMAVLQAVVALLKLKPNAVLCMGGFVSGPVGVAAWLLRKPLLVHEQNAIAGYTNRILTKFACRVLQAFPNVFKPMPQSVVVGNPVRADILQILPPEKRLQGRTLPLRIFVLGGSQGARAINHCLIKLWQQFPGLDQLEIWHQTGKVDYEQTRQAYEQLPLQARVDVFIKDMVAAYNWADVVICRAGALTVSELADVGLPAIFIPLPHAVDNHQYYNAKYLQEAGAAIIIEQHALSVEGLQQQLCTFLDNRDQLLVMANAAYQLGQRDATEQVARYCIEEMSA